MCRKCIWKQKMREKQRGWRGERTSEISQVPRFSLITFREMGFYTNYFSNSIQYGYKFVDKVFSKLMGRGLWQIGKIRVVRRSFDENKYILMKLGINTFGLTCIMDASCTVSPFILFRKIEVPNCIDPFSLHII